LPELDDLLVLGFGNGVAAPSAPSFICFGSLGASVISGLGRL